MKDIATVRATLRTIRPTAVSGGAAPRPPNFPGVESPAERADLFEVVDAVPLNVTARP